ncbi:hypothetical protein JQ636_37980 [Bradyrhizobium japonicum]|uniref:hypothetical protein n=1 Tax=Bradyrhizobium japonicum TaxID=375 RepID=UPI001BA821AC|nr:hypothetical protein [Bradyrhizobium japonicum]MBR0809353.1 hypothetical protein [Bradyrhizobium japonicum]
MSNDPRILDDDELIDASAMLTIMGEPSVSTAYEDPEIQALKISMTPPGKRSKMVRWIKREVLALRAERVSYSEASAAKVRAEVEARVEQRRAKQRLRHVQRKPKAKTASAEA